MLPLRSDCAQRKHTSCNVSFYKAHKSMQAYPCAIVMHVLTTCFRSTPIVLNANTLRATFHLFYRTIYASIKCGKINETPSQVRVFALAGAIGIEPTQWESEAQVLPLHQAPSRTLLYITARGFAIVFD